MKVHQQIKAYRLKNNLSQEELAEKIYVTRQTVSNWETEKSYPDIHSLLLMSNLFNITLDQMVKGDLEKMKGVIRKENIDSYTKIANLYSILLIGLIIAFAPLAYFGGVYGYGILALWFIILLLVAIKVEKLKKENGIQTYKEIVAFMNGERLDEITKEREYGKRHYQTFLLALGVGLVTFIVVLSLLFLFSNW